jgi:HD superfamily phosphohydrolase
MDQQFFDWLMRVFPDYRFTTTPNELAWRLAVPSTHEYYEEEEYEEEGDEEGEAYGEEEEKEEPREELPPAPEYVPEEFHEVAKRIYGALIRLAEEENRAAHLILEEVNRAARLMSEEGKKAQSFFIRGYTPLEEIEEATATVYLTNGEEREIDDLKSDNPLGEVEKIMEEQIQEWIRWIA